MTLNTEHSYLLWQKGDFIIRREMLANLRDEAEDITKLHWEEIANYKDTIPLEPDWDQMLNFEKLGRFYVLTLRENDILIGYATFQINTHLHYKSLIVGNNTLLFIKPDKRLGRLGGQMIDESEKYLKTKGINKITWHMKPHRSFAPLLERRGYKHEESTHGKLI